MTVLKKNLSNTNSTYLPDQLTNLLTNCPLPEVVLQDKREHRLT